MDLHRAVAGGARRRLGFSAAIGTTRPPPVRYVPVGAPWSRSRPRLEAAAETSPDGPGCPDGGEARGHGRRAGRPHCRARGGPGRCGERLERERAAAAGLDGGGRRRAPRDRPAGRSPAARLPRELRQRPRPPGAHPPAPPGRIHGGRSGVGSPAVRRRRPGAGPYGDRPALGTPPGDRRPGLRAEPLRSGRLRL
ncbi:hypothetical protein STAFG_2776 [Streptomyces afghaniensis 772]|uniref:Uncharacterized protein n=1 Tax=Streptomyces afghaniensis 772 TaxID=1283301 RepID=S4MU14_9ACTN|nr:hypothetical protein STAFG_2776 [Streptomyces afghaniensis 772]